MFPTVFAPSRGGSHPRGKKKTPDESRVFMRASGNRTLARIPSGRAPKVLLSCSLGGHAACATTLQPGRGEIRGTFIGVLIPVTQKIPHPRGCGIFV